MQQKGEQQLPVEVVSSGGFVFHEAEEYTELLCPPKLLPIKSFTLVRLEKLEKRVMKEAKEKRAAQQQARAVPMWRMDGTPSTASGVVAGTVTGDGARKL